jgi:putative inorganic carbon (hco3(-)) transporter
MRSVTWPRPASAILPRLRGTIVGLSPERAGPLVQDGGTLGVRGLVILLFAPWIALAGSTRKILLAILLLDIPLQVDENFKHLEDAAEFGAIGGFNISVTTVALAGLYAAWLVDRMVRRDRSTGVPSGLVGPLSAYVCTAALSLVVARDVGLYSRGLFLLVQMVLVYVYLVGTVRSVEDVRFVVTWLLWGLVIESLIIIGLGLAGEGFEVAGLSGRVVASADAWESPSRFGGTVGSPNNAAEYLEMLLAPAVAVMASTLGRFRKTLAAAGLALGSAALIGTLSRGGWIATGLSLAIVFVALWRRGRPSLVLWLAGLIVATSLIFHDSIAARLTGDDSDAAYVRLPLMTTAFRIIADNPVLGVGANNYTAALPDYASTHHSDFLYTVHNQYLLVWAETGLVGLAAFMWFLIATIRRGFEGWKRRAPLLSLLALGFTAALVGQMVHMQVDLLNGRPQVQLLVTVAALIGSMSRMEMPGWRMLDRLPTARAGALTAVPALHVQQ